MKAILLISIFSLFFFSCQPEKVTSDSSSEGLAEISAVKNIRAMEFKNLSKEANTVILDVRTPAEVADGKIPNAIVIDIQDPEFKTKALLLDKKQSILVYCSAGVRSAQAAEFLHQQGFEFVYHLNGGLGEWFQNDFSFEK
jgi:rhodanese-related sulfurtransferase